jgi:hypothetical protein
MMEIWGVCLLAWPPSLPSHNQLAGTSSQQVNARNFFCRYRFALQPLARRLNCHRLALKTMIELWRKLGRAARRVTGITECLPDSFTKFHRFSK